MQTHSRTDFKIHYPLVSIIFASIAINDVAGSILRDTGHSLAKRGTFQWGVVGDSWASGVAYLDSNAYDNNTSGCMRTTESYGAQLVKDTSWTNGWTKDFSFPACSGSALVDIAKGQKQIENLGSSPKLAVMTSGGNNALFYRVVDSCIYHSEKSRNYGLPYADDVNKTNDCAMAINNSTTYINNGLSGDLNRTFDDIFLAQNVMSQPDFLLYLTEYAQFFNLNDDWCDCHSFSIRYWDRPHLSHVLRADINGLVTKLNAVYNQTIRDYPNKNVRFIDLDSLFDDHRFCEAGSTLLYEYCNSNIWFWDALWPWGCPFTSTNVTEFETELQAFSANMTITSRTGAVSEGYLLRHFHPKIDGHTAIKDAITAQMRIDNIPRAPAARLSHLQLRQNFHHRYLHLRHRMQLVLALSILMNTRTVPTTPEICAPPSPCTITMGRSLVKHLSTQIQAQYNKLSTTKFHTPSQAPCRIPCS